MALLTFKQMVAAFPDIMNELAPTSMWAQGIGTDDWYPVQIDPVTGALQTNSSGGGGGAIVPTGTTAAPILISAAGGITPTNVQREMIFIAGNGAAITVTKNPQIAVGTAVGQELILEGCHNTNTVTINNGTGLILNGTCVLKSGSIIYLIWNGSAWAEVSRNDI